VLQIVRSSINTGLSIGGLYHGEPTVQIIGGSTWKLRSLRLWWTHNIGVICMQPSSAFH